MLQVRYSLPGFCFQILKPTEEKRVSRPVEEPHENYREGVWATERFPPKALRPEKERGLQYPMAAGTVLALLHRSKAREGRARLARVASNPRTFAQKVIREEAGEKKKRRRT